MNCASFDLKSYALGEAPADERRAIEQHLKACNACGHELARLELTHAALMTVRDEEMPRRIAFVSDKVFEPRWYERLFGAPRWGFASAGLLAGAIMFHALWQQPAARPAAPLAAAGGAPVAVVPAGIPAADVEAIVSRALVEAAARQEKRSAELLAARDRRQRQEIEEMKAMVNVSFESLSKRVNQIVRNTAEYRAASGEGVRP